MPNSPKEIPNVQRFAPWLTWTVALSIPVCIPGPSSAQTATDQTPPDRLLLKDYRPRVIYKVPRTTITRAQFPVVDMHAHPRYARTLEQVDQWVRTMDDLGLERTVLLAGTTKKDFDQVVAQFAKHRHRFLIWCGLDLSGIDEPGFGPAAVAELERCYRGGATGVGELSDKGAGLNSRLGIRGVHLDDTRLDPLLKKCAE